MVFAESADDVPDFFAVLVALETHASAWLDGHALDDEARGAVPISPNAPRPLLDVMNGAENAKGFLWRQAFWLRGSSGWRIFSRLIQSATFSWKSLPLLRRTAMARSSNMAMAGHFTFVTRL